MLRGLAVLLVAVLLVVAAGHLILAPLRDQREAARQSAGALAADIERLRERVALLGTPAGETALAADLAYRAESASAAEIALQRDVLALAEAAQIFPFSFGPSPPAEGATPRAGFDLEFEAAFSGTLRLLTAIEGHRPRIAIESLSIRQLPPRPDLSETPVSVRLGLWSFVQAEAPP